MTNAVTDSTSPSSETPHPVSDPSLSRTWPSWLVMIGAVPGSVLFSLVFLSLAAAW